jgi:FtsH-binding integral membrane protein
MEELLTGVSVPAIAAVVYFIVELIKYTTKKSEKVLRFIPIIAAGIGLVCGAVAYFAIPKIVPTDNVVVALVIGAASGLTATGFNQIIKQAKK